MMVNGPTVRRDRKQSKINDVCQPPLKPIRLARLLFTTKDTSSTIAQNSSHHDTDAPT